MNLFDECPICKSPYDDRYRTYNMAYCTNGGKHLFKIAKNRNGIISSITYDYVFPEDLNAPYYDIEIYWETIDQTMEIWQLNLRTKSFHKLETTVYFEPDFSDLPKLHNKIATILTFS